MGVEWIIGIAAGIVCALVGVIYWSGQSRDDKQDARFERDEKAFNDHSREDASMHERIVRVETKVETLEGEMSKVRDMRHDILDKVTRALGEWYVNILERLKK